MNSKQICIFTAIMTIIFSILSFVSALLGFRDGTIIAFIAAMGMAIITIIEENAYKK